MSKKLTFLLLSFVFTFLIAPFSAYADTLEDILQQGKLRVGVSLFSPWVMKDSNGNLAGFEVDVAKQIASDMGVKPEFKIYNWEDIIQEMPINQKARHSNCQKAKKPENLNKVDSLRRKQVLNRCHTFGQEQ